MAELDRAKTLFFSNISHELRTPLTLMLGPTTDALRSPARTLEGHDLEIVHRNALRLQKLVGSLLDFARIEAGRARASLEPVRLDVLTGELASAFDSAMREAGLAYEVSCEPLPQPVLIDPDMWEKILLNLISNALKFTFEGRVRVSLGRSRRPGRARGRRHGHRDPRARAAARLRAIPPRRRARGRAPRKGPASGSRWCTSSRACWAATSR